MQLIFNVMSSISCICILRKDPCWWQFSIETSLLHSLRLQLSLTCIYCIWSLFSIQKILRKCLIILSYICVLYLVLYRINLSLHGILNSFIWYHISIWIINIQVLSWVSVLCIHWDWAEVIRPNISLFIEWKVFSFYKIHFLCRVYFSLTLCYHRCLEEIVIALAIVSAWWHFSVRFKLITRAV